MQQKKSLNQKNFYNNQKDKNVNKLTKNSSFDKKNIKFNGSSKKNIKFLNFSEPNKFKFNKKYAFLRKILKTKLYSKKSVNKIKNPRIFSHRISIVVKSNNIFCNLTRLCSKKKLKSYVCSSGKYKIKTSKKNLRYTFSLVLNNFIDHIKKKFRFNAIIVNITSAVRIRKKIVQTISSNFKQTRLLVRVIKKKTFNGCRPAKRIRKKRRRLAILK